MKKVPVALSTISVSPHLTAVFEEFAKLRPFTYFYHYKKHDEQRATCGWTNETSLQTKFVDGCRNATLETAPILIEAMRDIDLIEDRNKKGLLTIYMSERWLKPFGITVFGKYFTLPGILRLLSPRYHKMAKRFAECLRDPHCFYLPQGIWAARDMARLCGLFAGDAGCLFRTPELEFERVPCGKIKAMRGGHFLCEKMRMWGYFVPPSARLEQKKNTTHNQQTTARILWIGRMLNWKRVDTLVRVAHRLPNIHFTIVGEGPEEFRLRRLAEGLVNVTFLKYQNVRRVRELMREHDAYVLTSDGGEGWGAALSEALEEEMCVYGTREAGSSASMLEESRLYSAGNVKELVRLLQKPIVKCKIGKWSGLCASKHLEDFLAEFVHDEV